MVTGSAGKAAAVTGAGITGGDIAGAGWVSRNPCLRLCSCTHKSRMAACTFLVCCGRSSVRALGGATDELPGRLPALAVGLAGRGVFGRGALGFGSAILFGAAVKAGLLGALAVGGVEGLEGVAASAGRAGSEGEESEDTSFRIPPWAEDV